jgi:hypothetical protein
MKKTHVCGKVAHENKQKAEGHRKFILLLKGGSREELKAYRCRRCGKWHIGRSSSMRKSRMARLEQLRQEIDQAWIAQKSFYLHGVVPRNCRSGNVLLDDMVHVP